MHILLADDRDQVRSALRLFLELELGVLRIDEVRDAPALLAHVSATPPHLILLDWELPGLSTNTLFPVLQDRFPDLLVIVLSGRLEARQPALSVGADAFFSKGDPPERLLTLLDTIIYGGLDKMKRELVQDWFTPEPLTIPPDMTLPEVHRLMTEKQIRRLPVMDNGDLVGIVTLGDVREAEPSNATSLSIWELNYLLAKLKIENVMTRNPITIAQDATIGKAASVMLENKISGLPVVDHTGKVIGIITESDIFRIVVQKWNSKED